MNEEDKFDNLILLTGTDQKLPVHLTLLFHLANKGDETATKAIIDDFMPSIERIARKIQSQYSLNYHQVHQQMIESGIQTLKDFISKHSEEGFLKFILYAIRENMIYNVATRSHNF